MSGLILMLLCVYAAGKYGGESAGGIAAGIVGIVIILLMLSGMKDGREAEHNFVAYWKKKKV